MTAPTSSERESAGATKPRTTKRPTECQAALAAAVVVKGDKRLGRTTPQWIVKLAKKAG